MNFLPNVPANIPLHCTICPKKPSFSDISHLLTHVASKAHLSNYYKTKVRGGQDTVASELVAEYDEWYDRWGVDEMMRERMHSKDKKTRTSSRRGSAAATTQPSSSRSTPSVPAMAAGRGSRQRGSLLDPQLHGKVKVEPKSRSGTPCAGLATSLDPAMLHRAFAPPMQQSWTTGPYPQSPIDLDVDISSPSQSSFEVESARLPHPTRRTRRRRSDEDASFQGSIQMDDEYDISETTNDAAKLKGVYWPGMAMFDSATPDMKRKRNQKKATSVVQQLLATSKTVEPTELIFDNTGAFRKQRTISGDPEYDDGGSPLKGESTPEPDEPVQKRKTGRRPRAALVERDINGARNLRRRTNPHAPGFGASRTPYFDGADEDDDLTYQPRPRQRVGMSIHRDDSGPGITFDQSAPFNLLTSGFSNPFQHMNHVSQPQPSYRAPQINSFQQQNYHRHQPRASFGLNGFRPASGSNSMPVRDLSAFGNFTNQSMFQTNNHFPMTDGNQAFAAFQHQLGLGPAPQSNFCTSQNMFGGQSLQNFDVFGFGNGNGNEDHGLMNNFDVGFQLADTNTVNPLFFSTPLNQPARDDDEVTVSAPASEHSPLA